MRLAVSTLTDGPYGRLIQSSLARFTHRPQANNWGSKLPFNAVCGDYGSLSGGWVHDVAFSPSGDALAFCSTYRATPLTEL